MQHEVPGAAHGVNPLVPRGRGLPRRARRVAGSIVVADHAGHVMGFVPRLVMSRVVHRGRARGVGGDGFLRGVHVTLVLSEGRRSAENADRGKRGEGVSEPRTQHPYSGIRDVTQ